MTYTLSPNSLKLYAECPRCFWFDVNKKVDRPSLPFPSLPSGMDLAIKRYFDRHRDAQNLPLILESLKGARLYSGPSFKKWRNNQQGLSWSDDKGNTLHGAIDDMLVFGSRKKKHSVLDYKTRGFKLKEETPELYRLPLTIYHALGELEGLVMSDTAYLAFFHSPDLEGDYLVSFKIDVVPMKVDTSGVKKLFYDAIGVLKLEVPPGPVKELDATTNEEKVKCSYCAWKVATS